MASQCCSSATFLTTAVMIDGQHLVTMTIFFNEQHVEAMKSFLRKITFIATKHIKIIRITLNRKN
jgi:hypothetical protein